MSDSEMLEEVKRLREENKELEGFLNDSDAANKLQHRKLIRAAEWASVKVYGDQEKVDAFWDYIEGTVNEIPRRKTYYVPSVVLQLADILDETSNPPKDTEQLMTKDMMRIRINKVVEKMHELASDMQEWE